MGQSLVKNFVHIVFSTKNRVNFIDEAIEEELFRYLSGLCLKKGCFPIKVGGHENHVHILCDVSQRIALESLLSFVKANSSRWIKKKKGDYQFFSWQKGYASFSVCPDNMGLVEKYISNQRVHHEGLSFESEFMGFVKKYDMEYDERFVWG